MHELAVRFLPRGGPVRIAENNSTLTPLVDGEQYFGAIRMEIGRTAGPGDVIYMLGWRFEANFRWNTQPGDPAELGTVLAQKAAAGVDVRVILPAKWQLLHFLEGQTESELRARGSFDLNNQLDRFGPRGNPLHAARLRSIRVGGTTPLSARIVLDHTGELFGIHHQKMVIIERAGGAVGFLGGIDFLADRLDSTRHDEPLPRKNPTRPGEEINYYWHDAGARVEGPAVNDLLYYFGLRWMYCATEMSDRRFKLKDGTTIDSLNPRIETTGLRSRARSTPLTSSAKALPGVFVAANFPERDVRGANPVQHDPHGLFSKPPVHTTGDLYKQAIAAARRYIYVEDQYFAAAVLEPSLREAAKRDVKIIAVMGGFDDDAGKAVAPSLTSPFLKGLGANFAMYQVKSTTIHSKLMIVDDVFVAIGSTNFSDRSLIEAKDSPGGDALRSLLQEMGQGWGTDSELTVSAVDDRGDDWNVALRLRVLLWAEHLRVDPTDKAIWGDLASLNTALSLFNPTWGKPVRFRSPNSRLVAVAIS